MQDATPAREVFTRLQKIGIGAVAVVAWAAFQFVRMLPWLLVLGLNALWFNNTYVSWGTVILVLILWWLFQPGHPEPRRVVTRADAPELFRVLDDLATRIDAPRIDEVQLDDAFNAGAVQTHRRWQPWRTRRVLVLGVPLLALVNTESVRAVIAHELGHFSHRHGRLGHWVYRTRLGWLALMEVSETEGSVLEQMAGRFAQWFAPWFARWSFAYSRSCEYEADAFAAQAVTPQAMAAALVCVEAYGQRHADFMGGAQWRQRVADSPVPPHSVTDEMRAHVLGQAPGEDDLQRVQHHATREADTHPALADRLGALGIDADAALMLAKAQGGMVAGQAWLASWHDVMKAHDAEWLRLNARAWHREHTRLRLQSERLASLRDGQVVSLERARLELAAGSAPEAVEVARSQSGAEASYLLGSALLAIEDASGCDALETCVRTDSSWVAAARTVLATQAGRFLDEAQRHRNDVLLQRATRRRELGLLQLRSDVDAGSIEPCAIDELGWNILKESLAGQTHLREAWLMRKDEVRAGDRRFNGVVLLMRIDPAVMNSLGWSEDDVIEDGLQLLRSVVPLNVLRLVWASFTTEPMPDALATTLAAHAACRLTT
jgi:Zn-dependent protease with chaperone function